MLPSYNWSEKSKLELLNFLNLSFNSPEKHLAEIIGQGFGRDVPAENNRGHAEMFNSSQNEIPYPGEGNVLSNLPAFHPLVYDGGDVAAVEFDQLIGVALKIPCWYRTCGYGRVSIFSIC